MGFFDWLTGKKQSKKKTKFGKAELVDDKLDKFQSDFWVLKCPQCSAQLHRTCGESVNGTEYALFECRCGGEYLVDLYTKEIFTRDEAKTRQ